MASVKKRKSLHVPKKTTFYPSTATVTKFHCTVTARPRLVTPSPGIDIAAKVKELQAANPNPNPTTMAPPRVVLPIDKDLQGVEDSLMHLQLPPKEPLDNTNNNITMEAIGNQSSTNGKGEAAKESEAEKEKRIAELKAREEATKRELQDVARALHDLEASKRSTQGHSSEFEKREAELMAKRIELQQRQIREFELRMHSDKVHRMKKTLAQHYGFAFITDEECLTALADKTVEETAALALMEFTYLKEIRKRIAKSKTSEEEMRRQREEREALTGVPKPKEKEKRRSSKRQKKLERSGTNSRRRHRDEASDDNEDSESDEDAPKGKSKAKGKGRGQDQEDSSEDEKDEERQRKRRKRRSRDGKDSDEDDIFNTKANAKGADKGKKRESKEKGNDLEGGLGEDRRRKKEKRRRHLSEEEDNAEIGNNDPHMEDHMDIFPDLEHKHGLNIFGEAAHVNQSLDEIGFEGFGSEMGLGDHTFPNLDTSQNGNTSFLGNFGLNTNTHGHNSDPMDIEKTESPRVKGTGRSKGKGKGESSSELSSESYSDSEMGFSLSESNSDNLESGSESEGYDDGGQSDESESDFDENKHKKKKVSVGKLRLDDAIAQGSMKGWSTARIRAWSLRDKNPNAYYYRFNEPGETQKNGKWDEAEKKLFLEKLRANPADGQWGLFSREIPGRVGYQCANFYRMLLESGELTDPRYVISKGKAKFVGKKETLSKTKSSKRRSKKRKRESGEEEDKTKSSWRKPSDKTWEPNRSPSAEGSEGMARSTRSNAHEDEEDEKESSSRSESDSDSASSERSSNPLPGMVDPITCLPMTTPAISPYGHVCEYETWLKCLQSSGNVCPFTKMPLKKRELTILTHANIEEFRDKILK